MILLMNKLWNNKWALSLTAGLLLGLSFPPFPFPYLVIIAFVLLLRLCDLTESLKEVAYFSYAGLLLWNIIVTYWLCMATVIGGIAAILANTVVMTLPIIVIKYFKDRIKNIYILSIAIASAWVTYEFLHHRWDLAWPWLSLGNAFSSTPWLVQYISVTGPLGITFWVLIIASLVYGIIINQNRRPTVVLIAFILIPALFSIYQYFTRPITSKKSMQVLVVQPNYDSYLELAGYDNALTPLHKIINYTDSMRTDSTDLILWPENAIQSGITQHSYISQLLSRKSREWHTTIISGASLFYYYPKDHHPEVVRKGNDNGRYYNVFNAAMGYHPDGSVTYYEKAKLVPIVERVPFVNFLKKIIPFHINWGNISGYGRGHKVTDFGTGAGRVTALVCYDEDFPDWVRQFVSKGSDIITIITNDGWWGNSSGYIQHFEYARLRAIENQRYVVRSANNGISCVIANNGKVLKRTKFWTRDAFLSEVPEMHNLTFYTRYGDWLGYITLFLTFTGIGYLIIEKRSV